MASFKQPGIDVKVGGEEYRVVAQRQGRLMRRLFGPNGVFSSLDELASATQREASFDSLYDLVGGRLYEVLVVFVPDFMPRWQFDGYASASAAERDEYDEEADRSPTVPEVKETLHAAIQVNGLEWLGKLKELVNPDLLRNQLNLAVARMGTAAPDQIGDGPDSRSSPPTNGASEVTSSGTSSPTPESPSGSASPSHASAS